MKKWIIAAVAAAMTAGILPAGAAQDGVILNETFNNYVTNSTETLLTHKGDANARVVEDCYQNKVFLLPSRQQNNELKADIKEAGESFIISAKIKFGENRSTVKIGYADASNKQLIPVTFQPDGKITAHNGKKLGSSDLQNYTRVDIGYNTVTKRYFAALDGRIQLSYCQNNAGVGVPSQLIISTAPGDDPGLVYVDDVRVYSGDSLRSDLSAAAYNPETAEFEEAPEEEAGNLVFINNNFDDPAVSRSGLTINDKGNVLAPQMDKTGKNGYLYFNKTLDTDPFFDIFPNKSVRYLVLQADLSCDKPGATTYLFRLRDAAGIFSDTFYIQPSGAVNLFNGLNVTTLKKGKFVNVAAAYDLRLQTFDVYVEGEMKMEKVAMQNASFSELASIRNQMLPNGGMGDLMIDNLKIYEGKEPRDLENVEVKDDYTVLPDSSQDIERLKGTVALHLYANYIFIKDHKEELDVRPFVVDGRTLAPVRAVAEAFDLQTGWDEATGKITLGGDIEMTVGDSDMYVKGKKVELEVPPQVKDGRAFIPLRALAEEALGKKVFYDEAGLIVISTQPFKYETNPKAIKELTTYMFSVRPDAEEILDLFQNSGYAGVHPRIMANAADFDRLREQSQTNEKIKLWAGNAVESATRLLEKAPSEYNIPDGLRLLNTSRETLNRLTNLGFAYQITRDTKFAERAWKEMEKVCSYPDWNPKHFLDIGEMVTAVAIGYDWCYDYLNEGQRKTIEDAIVKFGLNEGKRQYMGSPTGTNYVFQDMNWNVVCNGGLSTGALAIMDVQPDIASYTLVNALRSMEYMITEFAPDGAWVEGPGYWGYTLQFFCYWMEAMKYSLGTDFGMPNYKGIDTTAYFIYQLDGNCGCNNFHDAGAGRQMPVQLFWLGRHFNNQGVTSARLMNMEAYNLRGEVWECLWYDTSVTGTSVDMPLDMYTRVTESGALRSSWEDKNGMYIGYNGGKNQVNHYHVDEGSFILDMMGERWAMDLGSDNLTYTNNFPGPRNSVYRIRAEGHNTIVINPTADIEQEMSADCPVVRAQSKPRGGFQVLDMTTAYLRNASKVERGYMLTGDRRTAVIRDEIELLSPSTIYWFMHTAAQIEITSADTAVLSIGNKRMQLKMLCEGGTAELTQMDAKPLPTTNSLQGEAVNNGVRKIAIIVKGSGKVAISVRLTPMDESDAQQPFTCEKIADWTIPDGELLPMPALSQIYLDGQQLEKFQPTQDGYTVSVPNDAQTVPKLTVDSGEFKAEILHEARDLTDNYQIKVTNDNGKYRIYKVGFRVLPKMGELSGYQRFTPASIYASDNPEAENMDINASDGDLDTRWSASGYQTLTYDFGKQVTVEAFAVAVMNGVSRTYNFAVEVSNDGKNFTRVYSGLTSGTTNDYEIYEVTPVPARYVRYAGDGNSENNWNSITEFGVLGTRQGAEE